MADQNIRDPQQHIPVNLSPSTANNPCARSMAEMGKEILDEYEGIDEHSNHQSITNRNSEQLKERDLEQTRPEFVMK